MSNRCDSMRQFKFTVFINGILADTYTVESQTKANAWREFLVSFEKCEYDYGLNSADGISVFIKEVE